MLFKIGILTCMFGFHVSQVATCVVGMFLCVGSGWALVETYLFGLCSCVMSSLSLSLGQLIGGRGKLAAG